MLRINLGEKIALSDSVNKKAVNFYSFGQITDVAEIMVFRILRINNMA